MITDQPDNEADPSGTHGKSNTMPRANQSFAKSAAAQTPILDTLPTAIRNIGSGCPARDQVLSTHWVQ
jgi:hypothetical protein